jgi:hypothetical protein
MGSAIEVNLVTVGEETMMTNPLTGKWEPMNDMFAILTVFDPATGEPPSSKASRTRRTPATRRWATRCATI